MGFDIKNYGLTPALHPVTCGDLFSVKSPELVMSAADDFFGACDRNNSYLTIMPTIFPSEKRPGLGEISSLENAISVMRRDTQGYFITRIRYNDVFMMGHTTYICRRLYWIANQVPPVFSDCGTIKLPDDD